MYASVFRTFCGTLAELSSTKDNNKRKIEPEGISRVRCFGCPYYEIKNNNTPYDIHPFKQPIHYLILFNPRNTLSTSNIGLLWLAFRYQRSNNPGWGKLLFETQPSILSMSPLPNDVIKLCLVFAFSLISSFSVSLRSFSGKVESK